MWENCTPLPIVTSIAIAGLCNRLRGIASGLIVAREIGYGFNVFWDANSDIPVHFRDLFEDPDFAFLAQMPYAPYFVASDRTPSEPWTHRLLPGWGCRAVGAEGTIRIPDSRPTPIALYTYHNLKPLGMPDEEFMRQKRAFLTGLCPRPYIQTAIDEVLSQFGPSIVGIHARATDTAYYWRDGKSPSQRLYFSEMDRHLEADPETMFFIASDSDAMLDAAAARYGSRAISSLRVLKRLRADRSSLEGQIEAVIDLYCLSKTNTIIGTHLSSFTYEAAAMGDIPLIEIAGRRGDNWHVPGSIVISEEDVPDVPPSPFTRS